MWVAGVRSLIHSLGRRVINKLIVCFRNATQYKRRFSLVKKHTHTYRYAYIHTYIHTHIHTHKPIKRETAVVGMFHSTDMNGNMLEKKNTETVTPVIAAAEETLLKP